MPDISLTCSDASTAVWGLFDFSIAPPLLFYSYIPVLLIACLVGLFVFLKEQGSLVSKLLLALCLSFAGLLLNEILQWIAAPVTLVMLGWELVPYFRVLISILTLYFVYVFIQKEDLNIKTKTVLTIAYITVLFLLPTTLNIKYFDIYNCEAIPGGLWTYVNFIAAFSVLYIVFITITAYTRTSDSETKKKNTIVGLGAAMFLTFFFSATAYGDFTTLYDVALAGPVGMLLFISCITFAIVRYKSFNIKLAAPTALIISLWLMVFSLLFVRTNFYHQFIVIVTLILFSIFGYALSQSIRREIKQREEIQKLAIDLEKANSRLIELDKAKSEFVSIASHQLRSPITAIAGYTSLMREGDFGEVPSKMKEPLERIEQSARMMASSIEDYLNVSRIESGNMKYNYSDFNLNDEVEHICDDLRPIALKESLVLLFKQNIQSQSLVKADIGKTQQIIHNLINNSIKYTPKGTITVYVHDDPEKKKIFVDIIDTGIGMNDKTIHSIFGKFSRADNANTVNVKGTGLGLYVAQKMAQAMGGNITAHSTGEGQGSTFTLEMKLG